MLAVTVDEEEARTRLRVRADGALRVLSAFVCALVAIIALAMIARVSLSNYQLSRDKDHYLVISRRPRVEDAAIVQAVEGTSRLKYLRSDEPFAGALAKAFKSDAASDLRAYRFKDYVAQQEISPSRVPGFVATQLRMESDKGFVPWLSIAALLGVAAGLAWVSKPEATPALLLAGLGVAVVKVVARCGACPTATIGGVDVAILGTALYATLFGTSLLWRSVAAQRLALLATGVIALWQVSMAWATHSACLPCGCLAFVASCGLASSLQWSAKAQAIERVRLRSPLWAIACVPTVAAYFSGGDPLATVPEGSVGSASWDTKVQHVANIRELGLTNLNRRVVLYIGHAGCRPCLDTLAALDAAGIKGLTFASIDREAPDAKRPWLYLAHGDLIHQTPSILFAEADGTVTAQVLGGRTDVAGLTAFSQQLRNFFSTAAQKGKKGT